MKTNIPENETPRGERWLSFDELVERGVLRTRSTLSRWIARENFPKGALLGPKTRRWREAEIEAWLASRRTAPALLPMDGRRGRRGKEP